MSKPVQYITNDQGERVGVLLDLNTYTQLTQSLKLYEDCLIGLSLDGLDALANCRLAICDSGAIEVSWLLVDG